MQPQLKFAEGVSYDEASETASFKLKYPLKNKLGPVDEITIRTRYKAGDMVAQGRGEKDNAIDGLVHFAAQLTIVSPDKMGYSVKFLYGLDGEDFNTLMAMLTVILSKGKAKPGEEDEEGEAAEGGEKKP